MSSRPSCPIRKRSAVQGPIPRTAHLAAALEVDSDDLLRTPVREPVTAVVPSRGFADPEAGQQSLRFGQSRFLLGQSSPPTLQTSGSRPDRQPVRRAISRDWTNSRQWALFQTL